MANKFTKQSYEEFTITADFVNVLDTGEGIASQTVEAVDTDGTDVAATVTDQGTISASGSQVSILVKAGSEAASPYKITFKIVTDSSPAHKWEEDVTMTIREL
jgi:hypothetical protein